MSLKLSITDSAVNLSSYTDIQLSAPPNPWSYNTSLILKVKPTGNCSTNKLVMLIRHEQASTMSNQPLSLSVVKDSTSTSVYNGSANIASIAYAMGYVTLNLTSTLNLNANEVYTFTFTVSSGKYDYRFYEIPSGRAVYSNNDGAAASLGMINSAGSLVATFSRVWIEIGDITPGGGGDGFDGGTINEPLEINCKFPYLADQPAINSWMSSAPLNPSNYSAYLRFTNVNNPTHSTDIYGITFKDDTNTDVPAIGINDSLLVRKNLFAQGYIRTTKSVLRLEKSTPYTPPNAGASGNVNIGTATWPFDEIFTSYGHIGNLTVPQGIYTDWIEGFTPNKPLTIGASSGGSIKLDGDVQITGTLTGGGGGGTFDGGVVHTPITIRDNYIKLYNFQADADTAAQTDPVYSWSVRDWLYGGDTINGVATKKPPGAEETPNIGLRFDAPPNGGLWSNLHNIVLSNVDPALGVTKHFFIRGDFIVRGPLNSHEGIIVLHGNGINHSNLQPATPGNFKTGWNIGWGPRKGGAPFIWLAEGGDYLDDAKQGGNEAASTLLIVTNNDKKIKEPPEDIPGYSLSPTGQVTVTKAYKWGHLEAGKIISHDELHTDKIGPVVPLRFVDNPSGLQAFLDATQIEVFTSLIPSSIGRTIKNLGDPTKQWDNLYVKNLHVSGAGGAGGIQKGSDVWTDATTGVANVQFPTAFPSGVTPVITCTPYDTQGRTISLVVTAKSNTGFTVKATVANTAPHIHKLGEAWANNVFNTNTATDGKHFHYAVGGANAGVESVNLTHGHFAQGTTNNVNLAHGHFAQGTTNNVNLAHGHFAQGTTANNGNHSHGVNAAQEWTTANSTPSHQHQYARAGGSSGNTANAGDHNHTFTNAPTDNALGNHNHTFTSAPTDNALGDHYHTFTNAPTDNALGTHAHMVTLTTSGGGDTANDAVSLHSHALAINNRGLALRDQNGVQTSIGGLLYNGAAPQVELYTESATANNQGVPVQVQFSWMAM